MSKGEECRFEKMEGFGEDGGDGHTTVGRDLPLQRCPFKNGSVGQFYMCLLQSEVIKHVRCGAKVQSQGAERAEEKKCCAEDPQEARVPPRPPRCSKLPGSQGQKGNWRMTRCSLSDKRKSSNSLGKINVLLAQKVRRDFSC